MRSESSAAVRRREMLELFKKSNTALTGSDLAKRFNVSRQIIIKDIAVLKQEGNSVEATGKGYYLRAPEVFERVFKLLHTSDQTRDELRLVVDMGGVVKDVFVWHKVYGRIGAALNIFSKRDVDRFMEGIQSGKSTELMHITDGYHYHTVRAETEEALDAIAAMLQKKGYLALE
jgi:transcriptional regulator of NAD metabolism